VGKKSLKLRNNLGRVKNIAVDVPEKHASD